MPKFEFTSRFQFSLRGMLIAVAVVAVLIWLSSVIAGTLLWAALGLIYFVLPTPLVIAAVYTRGDIQAFAIGALVPWVASWGAGGPHASSLLSLIAPVLSLIVMAAVCGIVAVASRRWIFRFASW